MSSDLRRRLFGGSRRVGLVAVVLAAFATASAEQRTTAGVAAASEREFRADRHYLNLPIRNGAPKRKIVLLVDGSEVTSGSVELADSGADWWAYIDISRWRGHSLTLRSTGPSTPSGGLNAIEASDSIRDSDSLYREKLRPQLHFSPRRGWMNDPNGLVFYHGEYHLFFQHNPYGWSWGNMHWGHAVSRDLVHWDELGDVLAPDHLGAMFSGSAVVDHGNTSGLGAAGKDPLVLVYTAWGQPAVQCLAFSDDGRTFAKYDCNPILPNITPGNRDPRVFWHARTQRWIMVLFVEEPAGQTDGRGSSPKKHLVRLFTSRNLRNWEPAGTVNGGIGDDHFLYECPDLFELPVSGDPAQTRWILTAADGEYAIGSFEGETFVPEVSRLVGNYGSGFYAAQTFNDVPDGRRIQIGWGQMPSPGMSFNQLQLLPCELRLIRTDAGLRLARTPIRELESLRDGPDQSGSLGSFHGEIVEVRADLVPRGAELFRFDVRGAKIVYDAGSHEITINGITAPAPLVLGHQRIAVYVDRTLLEVFASDGITYVPVAFIPKPENRCVDVNVDAPDAGPLVLRVYELKSIWTP
ncbi:MAG TPA: glycoside hydrolase family 32 protein [Opitutaceae bacterium]|nr:glycoside hydrolase family 32 protein [Opitutaceae bacterium]